MRKNDIVVVTSPNTWIELRVLYESGKYPNLNVLYENTKDKFSDMPDLCTLIYRCEEEGWDKERFQEIKTEVKRRNLIELYSSLGMDEKEQARYRIECVKVVDGMKDIINKLYHTLDGLDTSSSLYVQTLSKIKVLTDTMLKGMNTSLAALQDISKLVGSYAPVSTKEIKAHSFSLGNKDKEIEDMTEEEIIQDLKRMRAAGIDLNEIETLKTPSGEGKQGNEP
jgi:hypothetical protein